MMRLYQDEALQALGRPVQIRSNFSLFTDASTSVLQAGLLVQLACQWYCTPWWGMEYLSLLLCAGGWVLFTAPFWQCCQADYLNSSNEMIAQKNLAAT